MRRRDFIRALAGSTLLSPLVVRAQQPAMPVIGFLDPTSLDKYAPFVEAFRNGLREVGLIAGHNLAIEFRWAEGQYARLPEMAADLVQHKVAVIVATGITATRAAKAATSTIPIVFAAVSDPVKSGLVASLNRPGGNITGNAGFSIELDAKRLELLSELAPAARAIGALVNPNRPGVEAQEKEMLAAAKTAGRELTVLHTGDSRAIEIAFATLTERKIAALLIGADALFNNHRPQVVALAARHGIVAMYPWNEFVTEGGLVSYAPSLTEAYRLSGLYVGRILNGERPADLPVIQPTKVELAINLKTARALGLDVPPSLLARADEVIE